jgi:hypothetical protein
MDITRDSYLPTELVRPLNKFYHDAKSDGLREAHRIDSDLLKNAKEDGYKNGLAVASRKFNLSYLPLVVGVVLGYGIHYI